MICANKKRQIDVQCYKRYEFLIEGGVRIRGEVLFVDQRTITVFVFRGRATLTLSKQSGRVLSATQFKEKS